MGKRPDTSISWSKKEGSFDVTMSAHDGAEVFELVHIFLLNEMNANKHKYELKRTA